MGSACGLAKQGTVLEVQRRRGAGIARGLCGPVRPPTRNPRPARDDRAGALRRRLRPHRRAGAPRGPHGRVVPRPICHPDANGNYASTVDQTQLPPPSPTAVDIDGNPVSLAVQTANRAYAVNAHPGARATERPNLIASFDTIFPAIQVNIVNTGSPDPTQSCQPATADGDRHVHPTSSPACSRASSPSTTTAPSRSRPSRSPAIFKAIQSSPDAQHSFAALRGAPGLPAHRPDAGRRAPRHRVPRPARPHERRARAPLGRLAAVQHVEARLEREPHPHPGPREPAVQRAHRRGARRARSTRRPTPLRPLLTTHDRPAVGRTILSRPWTDLEVLEQLFYASDPAYRPRRAARSYIALRDPRGYAARWRS